MKPYLYAAALSVVCMMPLTAQAQSALTVTVNDASGETHTQSHSADDLLAMDVEQIVTVNDYVTGETTFTGPLVRDLLPVEDLQSYEELEVTALNGYRTTIPVEDILSYDVIVAVLRDGEPMPVRDKGPFWIIYPMSDHEELRDPIYNDRLAWHLSEIEITEK